MRDAKTAKSKGGRPTKYGPYVVQRSWEYFEHYEQQKTRVPYLEELDVELEISRDTRNRWVKKYPDFAWAISMIKTLQHCRLIERCLYSRKHPSRYIFLLKTLHGMREHKKLDPPNEEPEQIIISAHVEYYPDDPEVEKMKQERLSEVF